MYWEAGTLCCRLHEVHKATSHQRALPAKKLTFLASHHCEIPTKSAYKRRVAADIRCLMCLRHKRQQGISADLCGVAALRGKSPAAARRPQCHLWFYTKKFRRLGSKKARRIGLFCGVIFFVTPRCKGEPI